MVLLMKFLVLFVMAERIAQTNIQMKSIFHLDTITLLGLTATVARPYTGLGS